jgi:hypothetical protein
VKSPDLRSAAARIGFSPQEAVRWLSPSQLWRTAVKVVLSKVFADYSDKREIQAALPATLQSCEPPPGRDEFWLDFVADTGDGFDATYTVASLVAADALDVDGPGEAPLVLPRAGLLVFGGDEVYPTASARGYEDRTKGVFRAALPRAADAPLMVALPGNHDWYDGLTAFLRIFCQQRPVGGWRTGQTRSYFAVQLPHGWWLVGLDSQLGEYIDGPQMRFFTEQVSARLQPGDGVIVCAATPSWVRTALGDPDAFNSLRYFDQRVIQPTGASIRLWLSGDLHHYARYEEAGPGTGAARQMVTCGLGGAYLAATHRLPDSLEVPPPGSRMRDKGDPERFERRARYPDAALSRRLAYGLLQLGPRGLPFRNPGFWRLAGTLHATLFLLLAFVLGLMHGRAPVDALRSLPPTAALALGGWLFAALAVAVVGLVLEPLVYGRRPRPPSPAAVAVALQLAVAVAALAAATAAAPRHAWPDWAVLGGCLLGSVAVTGLAASYAFAAYVSLARSGLVAGWQMSAQSIEDHKGFLRLRIDPDGTLTLYPLAVDTVCRDWTVVPDATLGERPVPASGELPRPRLIEAPVPVARSAAAPPTNG